MDGPRLILYNTYLVHKFSLGLVKGVVGRTTVYRAHFGHSAPPSVLPLLGSFGMQYVSYSASYIIPGSFGDFPQSIFLFLFLYLF